MKRKHANDPPHQPPPVVTSTQGQLHELLALKVMQTIVGIALHKQRVNYRSKRLDDREAFFRPAFISVN